MKSGCKFPGKQVTHVERYVAFFQQMESSQPKKTTISGYQVDQLVYWMLATINRGHEIWHLPKLHALWFSGKSNNKLYTINLHEVRFPKNNGSHLMIPDQPFNKEMPHFFVFISFCAGLRWANEGPLDGCTAGENTKIIKFQTPNTIHVSIQVWLDVYLEVQDT